jgi:hypothetical protein
MSINITNPVPEAIAVIIALIISKTPVTENPTWSDKVYESILIQARKYGKTEL